MDWEALWGQVAEELGESWTLGLGQLLTEDVLRFATIKAMAARGVPPNQMATEWRRPGVPDSVDLVVLGEARVGIEFKYPREPREVNAAWTQHLGELLKDFYRLAYMPPEFGPRWAVVLLAPRMTRYLGGVRDRHQLSLGLHPGHPARLDPAVVRSLPATARTPLARWLLIDQVVQARCAYRFQVGELTLTVHEVGALSRPPA